MIYLLRHGQTEFNRDGRFQGSLDSPLTELGRAQATEMGTKLSALIGSPAGWLLQSSPLARARASAERVRAALGAETVAIDERLREIMLGSWEGLTHAEIDAQAPGVREGPGRYGWLFHAPGGESLDALNARLADWLAEARADARPRIVVSHGVARRALCALVLGTTLDAVRAEPTPQDLIFRIEGDKIDVV